VRVEYERSTDQAYIYLRDIAAGDAVKQIPIFEDDIHVVLDLDIDGRLIGVDVMAARHSLPPELLKDAPEPDPPPT
jgi:uncharacterized protein YuzE